jgi:hypothetical protein
MKGAQTFRNGRGTAAVIALVLLVGVVASLVTAPGAAAVSRYSLANRCWTLTENGYPAPLAAQQRLKATRLGSYMLYGVGRDFLAATSGSDVGRADTPSADADWKVTPAGAGTFRLSPRSQPGKVLAAHHGAKLRLVARSQSGKSSQFLFAHATGCKKFPEAHLDVSGKPTKGKTSYGQVKGVLDGHMHWMTFEYLGGNFHCGRPWSPYGITVALPDCASIEGPEGSAAPVQNFLNYGAPEHPHDTKGWPTFTAWAPSNLTYEGTYYRWVQRAWKAGLRLIVMPVNENRILCQLMTNRRNSCDEMATVRKGIRDIKHLQNYVDAQAGGPGKGWFQIVRNPFQARKVINKGKMAVVLEVEVSELFDCTGADPGSCDRQTIKSGLNDLHRRGVRSSLLLNKFDNPLAGVRFDSGQIGNLINGGNKLSYGKFWNAQTCTGNKHDNEIETEAPPASGLIASLLTTMGVPPGTFPAYPPAPHCNTVGLSNLGAYTERLMMRKGMIVNPDHMSQKAVAQTLDLLSKHHYSGVISPHGWMDPRNWPKIWKLGGMAFPGAGSAQGFVQAWRTYRPKKTPYYFGWGYGADMGGLAHQGDPVDQSSPDSVKYPFKSLDGRMTIRRDRTGKRTFDYAKDGVITYGQYPDWLEEVRKTGGPKIARDMLRGSEAYLEMWERAIGIKDRGCVSGKRAFTPRGLGRLRLGRGYKRTLETAGQPIRRTRAWSYCVRGKGNKHASNTAVLTPHGRVALVASTAAGNTAHGVGVGIRLKRPEGAARSARRGGYIARKGNAVFVVRGGVVRTVGVASPRLLADPAKLRSYVKRVPRHGVNARPSRVITTASSKVSPEDAVPLAQQQHGAQFAFVCGL